MGRSAHNRRLSDSESCRCFTVVAFISLVVVSCRSRWFCLQPLYCQRFAETEEFCNCASPIYDDTGQFARAAIPRSRQQYRQITASLAGLIGQIARSVQMLTDIADLARGLVDSMSDIVWPIDPGEMIWDRSSHASPAQFASDVLDPQGINWQFVASAEIEKIRLNPEQRRHLFLIFKESLNNIARHAGAKNVSMNLSISGNHLQAEITDARILIAPARRGARCSFAKESRRKRSWEHAGSRGRAWRAIED